MDLGSELRQLPPGTMLDDKYRVESLIAVGGMGAVYVGTHTKLRKRVAIKVLNPELSTPPMIERFHREAITASQVGHEGIAQVTDLGTSMQGEPFLVMELLEGESLGKRLRATGPMPTEVACELACSILRPLGAAHAAGIVHRDLKPDNVFLVQQSRGEMVKLLDFGISRATGLDTEFRLTTTGLVLGTPFYMSPEQAQGASEVTPASDLYSLGVMLYEMLIGKVPIQGDNYNQLMYRVITGEFVPPGQLRSDLSPALERIILRAMALEPADRPATAAELEHDLLVFCRPTFRAHTIETGAAARIGFQPLPPAMASSGGRPADGFSTDPTMFAGGDPRLPPSIATQGAPRPGSRWWLLGGVTALIALGVIGALLVSQPGSARAPAPAVVPAGAPAPAAGAAPGVPVAPAVPAPPVAPAPPAPPESPAAPADRMVRLRFAVEPADALITLDGAVVTGAEIEVVRDDAQHRLLITAPGYVPDDEQIRYDESQRLVVQLKAVPRSGGRHTRPSSPTKRDRPTRPDRIDSQSPYK